MRGGPEERGFADGGAEIMLDYAHCRSEVEREILPASAEDLNRRRAGDHPHAGKSYGRLLIDDLGPCSGARRAAERVRGVPLRRDVVGPRLPSPRRRGGSNRAGRDYPICRGPYRRGACAHMCRWRTGKRCLPRHELLRAQAASARPLGFLLAPRAHHRWRFPRRKRDECETIPPTVSHPSLAGWILTTLWEPVSATLELS